MVVRHLRHSKEEFAQPGDEIYESHYDAMSDAELKQYFLNIVVMLLFRLI